MAKIRQHRHYSDTKAELAQYKDAFHGAVEDAFWDEDELVDHRPSSKSKSQKPKKAKGCPENDFGPHVYVWVTIKRWGGRWDRDRGLFVLTREKYYLIHEQTCCGCDKVKNRRYDWKWRYVD